MSEGSGVQPPRKGRGFPPKEHQFRRGESGNPRGRPVGAKNKAKREALEAGLTPGDVAAMEEGHRMVKSTDGTRLPTIHAIHRARNIGAMKGSRLMAKDADNRLMRAEEKRARIKQERFDVAFELQSLGERMINHLAKQGITDHEVYPHPDDIHIDYATMEVRIEGPMSATEKRRWDEALKCLAGVRRRVLNLRRQVEKDPGNDGLQYWLLRSTIRYDEINEVFPERYRLKRLPI